MPSYTVLQGVVHRQKAYEPGSEIKLPEEQAYPLVRLGYLEDPNPPEPVEGSALESPDAPKPLVQGVGDSKPRPAPRSTTSRKAG
jgi:hypothetical protein